MANRDSQFWANIAIIIGAPIAVASIIASVIALYFNKVAIDENRQAIVAQTAYQMQVDGRAQIEKLYENPQIYQAMIDGVLYENIDDRLLEKAGPLVLSFFQYYSAVHFQRKLGNFPDGLWPSFNEEFCNFVRIPIIEGIWENDFSDGSFNADFKTSITKCLEAK